MTTAIIWFRHDLRLADHAALTAALEAGYLPIPVFVHAPHEAGEWIPGAASRAWLDRSLRALEATLRECGSRLIVRAGDSLPELERLIGETAAKAVFFHRHYEPSWRRRDERVIDALQRRGVRVQSFGGALLNEPAAIANKQGEPYRVFTPYWREASARLPIPRVLPAPRSLPKPPQLASLKIDALGLAPRPGWDAGFWQRWQPGEQGAAAQLDAFLDDAAASYLDQRNLPDRAGTSRLSPHLHFGEISPNQIRAAIAARRFPLSARKHLDGYLRELGWREFSYYLLHHFPHTPTQNLNTKFDALPWADENSVQLEAWRRGRTGVPIVDAGMRELWSTGWMHNRVRMLTASFLAKNLRQHWLHGARWFWDTLVDADLANNTQGWQWIAGTGADAAPYFRIFNPVTQGQRFDPRGRYVRQWLPELAPLPDDIIHAPWTAPLQLAAVAPGYPRQPLVDLAESRAAALAAYQRIKK